MNKEILKEWIELNVDADLIGTKTSDSGDVDIQYYSKETFINALMEFNKQTNLKGIEDDVPESIGLSAEEVAESLKALKELFKTDQAGAFVPNNEQIRKSIELKNGCSCENPAKKSYYEWAL